MNWLTKINLRIAIAKLGLFQSALILALIISTTLYSGYRLGNFYHSYQAQKIQKQSQQLDQLYKKISEQHNAIDMLEVEFNVEYLASEHSKSFIKKLEQSNIELKTQLAFFEKIMAPENEINGIVLDDFKIIPTSSKQRFRFESMVIQQQKNKRYAKGYIDLVIEGSLNNKSTKLALSDISSFTEKELSFSFRYFQQITGEFIFPENFIPEQILVRVVLPKGKWQKFNQLNKNYTWSEVFEDSQ